MSGDLSKYAGGGRGTAKLKITQSG